MDWKVKSRIIGTVEALPFSSAIYYVLQRYGTRSIPRPASSIAQVIAHEHKHLEVFRKFTQRDRPDNVYEFGAGWDLCAALVRSDLGLANQRSVDLFPLAKAWQVNHVISHLAASSSGTITANHCIDNLGGDLSAKLGISYAAPFDARATNYPANVIDLIVSTNTMEHIPFRDLKDIMLESRRILRDDGIISTKVDYSDHYSHADGKIGPYNFLQFSEHEWKKHNHDFHFQNRRRHSDYARLFEECGFTILEHVGSGPDDEQPMPPLDPEFQRYDPVDLRYTEGRFVLAKN